MHVYLLYEYVQIAPDEAVIVFKILDIKDRFTWAFLCKTLSR